MMPAERIDTGEVVISGSAQVPSVLYAPSVMGQATVGVGGGDVTANLGGPWRMQIELEANAPVPAGQWDGPLPPGRISIGVFRYGE